MSLAHPEKYHYVDQYSNEANWKAHFEHTAPEIWNETRGEITHFVAGLGTTGTFTGTGRGLKKFNPDIELVALQPETALHGLEGWKHLETARVPKIYDNTIQDRTMLISTTESYDMIVRAAKEEGLLLSPSAAANLAGALRVAESLYEGVVVTVLADDASKYSDVLDQLMP